MAEGSVLRYTFMTDNSEKKNVNFKYADATADRADVIAAGQAMVTQTAIFRETYTSLVSAKIITTTELEFEIPTP